jgi:hypothetical protein
VVRKPLQDRCWILQIVGQHRRLLRGGLEVAVSSVQRVIRAMENAIDNAQREMEQLTWYPTQRSSFLNYASAYSYRLVVRICDHKWLKRIKNARHGDTYR